MTLNLASVTVVAVVGAGGGHGQDRAGEPGAARAVPGAHEIGAFVALLAQTFTDVEVVLVAGEPDAQTSLALKALVLEVPDLTVLFLAKPVHADVARLVGVEHAVGDYVLFADLIHDEPTALPALLAPIAGGYDLIVAQGGSARPRGFDRVALPVYRGLFRLLTGTAPELRATGLRVLSRAAALHVVERGDAELAVRARTLGASYPACAVPIGGRPGDDARVRLAWSRAVALLLNSSRVPLRAASYASLLAGCLSALYSLYVFGVFLLKPDVASGWTTLSLQVSGMMLVFSVVLLCLSEYVIQIHASAPPRRHRHLVVREIRSALSRRDGRLNLVDGEGRFVLGKPAWMA